MCRLSRYMIRKLGRGGTDMPGRIAVKLCPGILKILAKDVKTVLVTGTNGKTTTARMIEQAMTDAGYSLFANKSGANLFTGITGEYALHASIRTGKSKFDYALMEVDEASLKLIAPLVDPAVIVVTNIFRDQLDRYGEVTGTLEQIRKGIAESPNAVLCLNADDSISASLGRDFPNKTVYYGIDATLSGQQSREVSDAPYCLYCQHSYQYDSITYGHLGHYRCPKCGYERPQPDISVSEVVMQDGEMSQVMMGQDGETHVVSINLPGDYNLYNAAACMAAAKALEIPAKISAESLGHFQGGFGRMEKFEINGTPVRMILVKNPSGLNQVMGYASATTVPVVLAVALTDKVSDGRDISWIWDAEVEKIQTMGDNLVAVYVSGNRAEDMALWFKYAGIPEDKIHLEKDYGVLLEKTTSHGVPVIIMPSYNGMLGLREKISKVYGVKEFWEE